MPKKIPGLPFEDELRRLIEVAVRAIDPLSEDTYVSGTVLAYVKRKWEEEIGDHYYAWTKVVGHPVVADIDFTEHGSPLDSVLARLDELAEVERELRAMKKTAHEFVPHFKLHRDGSVTPLQDDTPAWTMDTMHEEDVPVALIVTEDAVEEVEITREPSSWRAGGTGVPTSWNLDKLREMRDGALQEWIEVEAIIREVEKREKEEAVDPVEDAAVAAFKAAWHRADEEGDEGNRVRRGIRAALHVLGQEASDE